jgi:valine dehydrogenase (NAD+)
LRAVIAVHSTALGPALGGVRFYAYADEDEALEDVLRLSKAMTYKNAAAGLDLGGGKAVIIGDPTRLKSEALLRAYGRFVNGLSGRYYTAEDVGTTQADMDLIRRETPFVTGVSPSIGGSGDPSAATAYGVFCAMRAVASHLWDGELSGRHVAVLGVGKVGSHLVGHLLDEGVAVTIADVDELAIRRVSEGRHVEVVPPEKAHAVECDIFSPCALGGTLNAATIPELRCEAVVGAANNQLAAEGCVELLAERNVLYAPDFVVNAGGVINIAEELRGYNEDRAMTNVARIFDSTKAVLAIASERGISTETAAEHLAEQRIEAIGRLSRIRTEVR